MLLRRLSVAAPLPPRRLGAVALRWPAAAASLPHPAVALSLPHPAVFMSGQAGRGDGPGGSAAGAAGSAAAAGAADKNGAAVPAGGDGGVRGAFETYVVGGDPVAAAVDVDADVSVAGRPNGLADQYHLTKEIGTEEKLEVSDPNLIFSQVWRDLEAKYGVDQLLFPKEIIWLAGAPGAGKGTMASHIVKQRDLPGVVETSSLFLGPKAEEVKQSGRLIGDREVIYAVLEALLDDKFTRGAGAVVDGFPRTMVQAQAIKLLFDKMRQLRYDFRKDPMLRTRFRRPIFRIAVLYVEEEESVRRQLQRGEKAHLHNKTVADTGVGEPVVIRDTDISEAAARERYKVFRSQVYAALKAIKGYFHFHFIPADAPPLEVKRRIEEEFVYQSSLELGDDTFELVRMLPPAELIVRHARQKMVQRLDQYARQYPDMFQDVFVLIKEEMIHIIQRQALAGRAIVRSNNPLLSNPVAVNMVLDIMSERGYFVTLEVQKVKVPQRLQPLVPGSAQGQDIDCKIEKYWVFTFEFPKPQINRGNGGSPVS